MKIKVLEKLTLWCITIACLSSCKDWVKDKDLTATLEDNRYVEEREYWKSFTSAPTRIEFHDDDDGSFFFQDNSEEVDFTFYETGPGKYRAQVEDEKSERTIIVRKIDENTRKVKFAEVDPWVVYVQDDWSN